ncbi:hypothetical protein DFH27DRAFT_538607 [Peziza echinospora]|nr:hypothetical protein DFH27DRAFT_538607 [Peziza echinospora]
MCLTRLTQLLVTLTILSMGLKLNHDRDIVPALQSGKSGIFSNCNARLQLAEKKSVPEAESLDANDSAKQYSKN